MKQGEMVRREGQAATAHGRALSLPGPDGGESLCNTASLADRDPLDWSVVEQTWVGWPRVSTLALSSPLPDETKSRGTSKNSVSRGFVTRTRGAVRRLALGAARHAPPGRLTLEGVHGGRLGILDYGSR